MATITEPQYLPTAPKNIGFQPEERQPAVSPITEQLRQNAANLRQQKHWLSDQVNFGYELSDNDYNLLSGILQRSDDWDTDLNKFEQALMYSKHEDIDLGVAYQNLDMLNEAFTGKKPSYTKSATLAIKDQLEIGILERNRSELGLMFRNPFRQLLTRNFAA